MAAAVIGIACSPRPGSNSTILLTHFLAGVKRSGLDTQLIELRRLKFAPCLGCEACSRSGECVLHDDLEELFGRIEASSGLVLAAPIFAMGINALGKGFIDRTQVYWARRFILKEPLPQSARRGYFISTAGRKERSVFEGGLITARYFFRILNTEPVGELLVNAVDQPGEIKTRSEELTQAEERGRLFARQLPAG